MTTQVPAQGPSQALNLGGQPGAYGDSFSMLNLFHGADAWITFDAAGHEKRGQVPVDARGWPTAFPVIEGVSQPIYANVFYCKIIPAGSYIVEWEGKGKVLPWQDVEWITPHKFRIAYAPDYSKGDDGITLRIDPAISGSPTPDVRNIKVYEEKYSDLVRLGETFNPGWYDAVDDFRVLRTHDWQGTNYSQVTDWTRNDQTADQAFWTSKRAGVPYEILVKIANETRSDLWINMPHMATDDYMRKAAAYVKAHLNPQLRVYVEYTNEYWSDGFDQHQYLIDKGKTMFGAGVKYANAQAYGARAAEMASIFKQAFGAEGSRLFPTVTLNHDAFNTAEALTMLTTPAWTAQGGKSPLQAGIKYLATDGYFGWFNTDPATDARVDGWIKNGSAGYAAARDFLLQQIETELAPAWVKGDRLAQKYGLQFGTYEGGALLINGVEGQSVKAKYTNFNERMALRPEMAEVYQAALEAWQSSAHGPFNWYSDTGRWGPWGDYGLWNAPDFQPEPRTLAITAANEHVLPWWTGDARPASVFANGKYAAGSSGADSMTGTAYADRLYGLGGSDELSGQAGNDRLAGGGGRDVLAGGAGHDILLGGSGNDTLSGGPNSDVFYFGWGDDTITDWQEGDHIAVKSVGLTPGDASLVKISQSGDDTVLSLAQGDKVWHLVLLHTKAASIQLTDDFLS